ISHFLARFPKSTPLVALLLRIGRRGCRRRPYLARSSRLRGALRRARSGLAIGFREPCLADAFLRAHPFPVTGEWAGSGGTCPAPHADEISRDAAGRTTSPNQLER